MRIIAQGYAYKCACDDPYKHKGAEHQSPKRQTQLYYFTPLGAPDIEGLSLGAAFVEAYPRWPDIQI